MFLALFSQSSAVKTLPLKKVCRLKSNIGENVLWENFNHRLGNGKHLVTTGKLIKRTSIHQFQFNIKPCLLENSILLVITHHFVKIINNIH